LNATIDLLKFTALRGCSTKIRLAGSADDLWVRAVSGVQPKRGTEDRGRDEAVAEQGTKQEGRLADKGQIGSSVGAQVNASPLKIVFLIRFGLY